uniref:Uncharacterized protein n=1 Tax=Ditylenchus dipsaci TaxID=166011 RepID=A0A915ETD2_9BILA
MMDERNTNEIIPSPREGADWNNRWEWRFISKASKLNKSLYVAMAHLKLDSAQSFLYGEEKLGIFGKGKEAKTIRENNHDEDLKRENSQDNT